MSRFQRGVIRTARLLDEVVTIGAKSEPERQPGDIAPDDALGGAEAEIEPHGTEPRGGSDYAETYEDDSDPDSVLLREREPEDDYPEDDADEPDAELLAEIDELRSKVRDLESANAEVSAAKAKLEAEIDGAKADYENKKKAIEAEAADIAAKAEAEAREKGYAEGRENGYKDGNDAARNEVRSEYDGKFASLASLLEGAAAKIEENFAQLVSLNQQRMLRLWFVMLCKMLNTEVEMNRDNVLNVLSDILTHLSDKNKIVLYVAPDDVRIINEGMKGEFQEVVRGVRHLEIKPDVNVDKGSCIVETDLGVYDARWRTQLEQIDIAIKKIFQTDSDRGAAVDYAHAMDKVFGGAAPAAEAQP